MEAAEARIARLLELLDDAQRQLTGDAALLAGLRQDTLDHLAHRGDSP
jgi:hypothetical protein